MEKSEIVKKFLANEILVGEGVLDELSELEDLDEVIEKTKSLGITILTKDILSKLLQKEKFIGVEDVAKVVRERYELMKKILEKKFELLNSISIKNIGRKKRFSLIGLISELTSSSLLLEDPSGQIRLRISKKEDLVEKEVVGCVCRYENGFYWVDKIVFPDFSLQKNAKKASKRITAIFFDGSKITKILDRMKTFTSTYLFSNAKLNIPSSSFYLEDSISLLSIENLKLILFDGRIILPFKKKWKKNEEEILLNLLRKRNLNPSYLLDNRFVLFEQPDLVCVFNLEESFSFNYKGTTVISVGRDIGWIIDLSTREILKLKL